VTLGQNCEIEGVSPVDEKVEFITQIVPVDKADGVDPLGIVKAFFKYPLDKPFYLTNGESGEQVDYNKNVMSDAAASNATNIENSALRLKARLITFQLVNKTGGNIATNSLIYSSDKTSVEYANTDALPGTDSITATVEVAFDTYANGSWTPFVIDGKVVTQKKIITFKTAEQPQIIPFSNIEYSYPIIDQFIYG
jgi:hypothetical protein